MGIKIVEDKFVGIPGNLRDENFGNPGLARNLFQKNKNQELYLRSKSDQLFLRGE